MTTVLLSGSGDDLPQRPKLFDTIQKKIVSIGIPDHSPITLELSTIIADHFEDLNSLGSEVNATRIKELLNQINEICEECPESDDTIFELIREGTNTWEGLYFPVLENLTDIFQELNIDDQDLLVDQLYKHEFGSWMLDTDKQSFLSAALFIIIKTSLIEEKTKKNYPDGENKTKHLEVIDNLRAMILYKLNYDFDTGNLSKYPLESFKDDFHILDLAKGCPDLKYFYKLMVTWNAEVEKGENLFNETTDDSFTFHGTDIEKDLVTSREMQSLRDDLLTAINPNDSEKQKALYSPLEYVKDLANEKRVTCVELSTDNGLENTQCYLKELSATHLATIDQMKLCDYKNFAIETTPYIYPIVKYLNRNEIHKSMQELSTILQDCFYINTTPNFRNELNLPGFDTSPDEVDKAIEFLDELWNKTRSGKNKSDVFLYTKGEFDNNEDINSWIEEHKKEKIGIFSTSTNPIYIFTPEDTCFIHHFLGFEENTDDEIFYLKDEIADFAHSQTEDLCAIPVKDNPELMKLINGHDELFDLDHEPSYATLTISNENPDMYIPESRPIDAYLITLIKDDDDEVHQRIETPAPFASA